MRSRSSSTPPTSAVVDALREASAGRARRSLRACCGAGRVRCDRVRDRDSAQRNAKGVQALLGRERVRQMDLPSRYEDLSFRAAVTAMERRLHEVPAELADAQEKLHALLAPRVAAWRAARERLLAISSRSRQSSTRARQAARSSSSVGPPKHRFPHFATSSSAQRAVSSCLRSLRVGASRTASADAKPQLGRPFEFLVRLLDLPRSGSLDPTMLMAFFLPLMIGVMVGDIAYGVLLLVISLLVRRRFGPGSPALLDLSRVFVGGALRAIFFGFLFGEALGNVGHKLGLPAPWFYRGGRTASSRCCCSHLQWCRSHSPRAGAWRLAVGDPAPADGAAQSTGALIASCGVLVLAGVALERIPGGALALALAGAAVIVGLVSADCAARRARLGHGPARADRHVWERPLLFAPCGCRTCLGVPGDGRQRVDRGVGPLWLGIFVGLFFHTLNVALASFSPMIQALRLHYVDLRQVL